MILKAEDLDFESYTPSGVGAPQNVNSAIKITHIPTNSYVVCQRFPSLLKNRDAALMALKVLVSHDG
jgi:protein subunit release factor A